MVEKMLRVHESFKAMLNNTLKEINRHVDKDHQLTMIELTRIMAINTNGNSGVLAVKMPVIILPEKNKRGRPKKPGWVGKYVNIVLEDEPR